MQAHNHSMLLAFSKGRPKLCNNTEIMEVIGVYELYKQIMSLLMNHTCFSHYKNCYGNNYLLLPLKYLEYSYFGPSHF